MSKIRIFKLLVVLISPLTRIKKLMKNLTARHLKIVIVATVVFSIMTTAILSYFYFRSKPTKVKNVLNSPKYRIIEGPMRHMKLDSLDPTGNKESEDEFFLQDFSRGHIIDTPGCQIPLQYVDYRKTNDTLKQLLNTTKITPPSCGKRAVSLRKSIGNVNIIIVSIYKKYLNLKRHGTFSCCYSFGSDIIKSTTPCKQVKHGDQFFLENEFISVKCLEYDKNKVSRVIYNDEYAFVKKNNITTQTGLQAHKFNVMMIGMDSMSPSRLCSNMPRTCKFIRENSWLLYRAYNKIGDNTFPNIMAALSGKNLTAIFESCFLNMDSCNKLMIWSKFKEAGYVTAFGEDNINLPATFHGEYGFNTTPTDHYLMPFFLHQERLVDKHLLCTGMVTSATQLLDYAYDFAHTYRNDSFFGFFWSNSFSHSENSSPHRADNIYLNFFTKLLYTGVMTNTFVIFFSDHGIRFGKNRQTVESYYDDRLPMFLMWVPYLFAGKHTMQTNAASYNQYRLVTPYDLYNTLVDINRISLNESQAKDAEACSNCHSIFRPVSHFRTCQDVNIDEKWCSCHNLFPLDTTDRAGLNIAIFILNYVNYISKKISTRPCWACHKLSLKKILRVHFYYDKTNTKLYYVVAVSFAPGNITYEATILKEDEGYQMVGPSSYLSAYNGYGFCALDPRDKYICLCKRIRHCVKTL